MTLFEKSSIILTPTAYDNGSINTVKPEYKILPQELVTNGTFDTDSDWNKATSWSIANGKANCDGNQTGNSNLSQTNVITDFSKTYRVEFTLSNYTAGAVKAKISNDAQGVNRSANGTYIEFLSGMSNKTLSFTANVDFIGSIDNVSVKEVQEADFDFTRGSSATRVNEQGVIEEVASNIPRIDYTSGQGALLLEPQRTNYVFPSNSFSSWSVSGGSVSITPNYGISPDGTQNSSRTDFSNGAVIYQTPNRPQGAYVFSVFAKNIEGGGSVIELRVDVPASFTTLFDLSNGTIVSSDNDDAKIEYYGNGWYRCIIIQNNDGIVNTVIGGGTTELDCELFGGMLEEGSYATSYIPTEGSTVTRSADVANNSGNADLFNDSEGVLCGELKVLHSSNIFDFGLYANTSTKLLRIGFFNDDVYASLYNGSYQTQMSAPNDLSDFTKIAFKFKENDFALWINGNEVATDTSGTTFNSGDLVKLNLSAQNGTSSLVTGNVKSLAVFKEALTDAELETLTSWISFTQMANDLEYTIE